MDPRTAAKVTAPDLLKAFNEGRGATEDTPDDVMLNIYVIKLLYGKAIEVCEFVLEAAEAATAEALHHLKKGKGHDVVMLVDSDDPSGLQDMREQISAAES